MSKTKPPLPPSPRRAPRRPSVESVPRYLNTRNMGYPLPMRDKYLPEWRATLRDAGYPMPVVVLDFETYFDSQYSMRKSDSSTIEYIMDDRFEVLGLSILIVGDNFPDYEKATNWVSGEESVANWLQFLQREYGEELGQCTVVAHNARFDGSVLAYRYGITPRYCVDNLGLAMHWDARARNNLDLLTKRFNLPAKGDTRVFKGWTNRVRYEVPKGRAKGPKLPQPMPRMDDADRRKLGEYANNDVKREWELFTLLLPRLSNPGTELRVMQHTLDLFWKPTLLVDEHKAEEIKGLMQAELDGEIKPTGMAPEDIRSGTWDEAMSAALERAGEDARTYHKTAHNCKRGWKIASAKSDPEREVLMDHPDPGVRGLMRAKAAMDSWPNHMARIDRIVGQARAAGGKLPVPLHYCGAHTGRWSGGEKINLQNLGSRGHKLVSAVRNVLLAPYGYLLVIADAAAIEARVLAWVANQLDLVAKFERGEEIYCGFAEKVLGIPVRKPKPDGIPAIEARHKYNRNAIGKVGILGCGYGMGPDKAVSYAKGAFDLDTAKKIVKTYRDEHPDIVSFWRNIERSFAYTFKYKQPCELNGLTFSTRPDCDVVITLPNGRELKYHRVRTTAGTYGESLLLHNLMKKSWDHIWGGHLTENVVQAISRDILWGAIAGLEADGYHVALHVHDEVVAVVPEVEAERALTRAVHHLRTRPKWAPGLPLDAEGLISPRFGTH